MPKRKFFIQWDSTNDCNLNCLHCYHNREREDEEKHVQKEETLLSFDEVKSMIDDLHLTTKRWDFLPRFQISGGEPMLRKDLMEILEYTQSLDMETRLLTNGTLITKEKANELYAKGVKRLQISLDGSKNIHNKIRGRYYAYDKALDGIRNSTDAGILVNVSMTIMQSNKRDLEGVIKSSINSGAKIVGFQSYVPDQNLGLNDSEFVDASDTYNLYQEIRELRKRNQDQIKVLETEVLWQIMQWDTKIKRNSRDTERFLSGCGAGFSGFSVLSDGTVFPCRRLPIPIGHINDGISKIMIESKVLQNLRNFNKIKNNGCCDDVYYCRGCRAIAYAVTGDYMSKDPMCFKHLVKEQEKEPRVIRR
ncbi:MAG: radical SAM protein [Nanoarchaeota archaeon]|nr:radical SAM protein [Nanoarchaeota archaeon]